jgi:hypothetical protein
MALLVMLNNYFHDLATAVFAVSAAAAYLMHRALQGEEAFGRVREVVASVIKLAYAALGWVIAAGVIRSLAYEKYEWSEAAGKDQVSVLVVKHIILVAFVAAGVVALVRARKLLRAPSPADGGH